MQQVKRNISCGLLTAALVLSLTTSVYAQADLLDDSAELIGLIPGTELTRDEFRARAQAQLTVVAVNAEVFRLVYQRYPESMRELLSSVAWNLDVTNMFTDRQVSWIFFEPTPEDLVPAYGLGIPDAFQIPPPPMSYPPLGQGNGGEDGDGGEDGMAIPVPIVSTPMVLRVDPARVDNVTAGDVFMYTTEETMQLLMYAPDGTVQELFHNSPNRFWHSRMQAGGVGTYWPDDLFAAQLLFYAESILPQSYNHVLFMSDRETLPNQLLESLAAGVRLEMAGELGITLLNPYDERPVMVVGSYLAGDIAEPYPSTPTPLHFCLKGNRVMTLEQLISSQQILVDKQENKTGKGSNKTRPSRPPLGGRN